MSTQSVSPDLDYYTIFNFCSSAEVEQVTLYKKNKSKNAKLVMESLIKELKLNLNYDTLNPIKPTKFLGTSKISGKTFKHIIDFRGRVKLLEI